MAVKTSEKATLSVGGGNFEDWESVWVQHTWGDAYSLFQFTCAERDTAQVAQQFKPMDDCTVTLAGQKAIEGYILTRQVAFDAYHHGVMLGGVNKTWSAARSSIDHKTSSFDNKDFKTIADEVLKPTGIKSKTEGTLDPTKFDFMHCAPGEPIFHFLERIGRDRKIIVTCTKDGEFLFVGEGRSSGSQGQLIEGQNILKMQCVISESAQYKKYIVRGQINANDKKKYEKVARQESTADGRLKKVYSLKIIPIEQGVYNAKELQKRADNESMWTEAQEVKATIVVQGWQPGGPSGGSGELWQAGKDVKVTSHMAMIDQILSIQQVTYTQDSQSGSLTTLVCVAPWGLNGTMMYETSSPPPPKPAQNTSQSS
jgi:prophage tail gpP-like protein